MYCIFVEISLSAQGISRNTLAGKAYFQYTAIDTASRWRYLAVYDEQSSFHSIRFLSKVIALFPHRIWAVKTDNHSTFTNFYTGINKRSDLSVKCSSSFDDQTSKYPGSSQVVREDTSEIAWETHPARTCELIFPKKLLPDRLRLAGECHGRSADHSVGTPSDQGYA